jgi:hypothetical protein
MTEVNKEIGKIINSSRKLFYLGQFIFVHDLTYLDTVNLTKEGDIYQVK